MHAAPEGQSDTGQDDFIWRITKKAESWKLLLGVFLAIVEINPSVLKEAWAAYKISSTIANMH